MTAASISGRFPRGCGEGFFSFSGSAAQMKETPENPLSQSNREYTRMDAKSEQQSSYQKLIKSIWFDIRVHWRSFAVKN
jgi:hypothetical protein